MSIRRSTGRNSKNNASHRIPSQRKNSRISTVSTDSINFDSNQTVRLIDRDPFNPKILEGVLSTTIYHNEGKYGDDPEVIIYVNLNDLNLITKIIDDEDTAMQYINDAKKQGVDTSRMTHKIIDHDIREEVWDDFMTKYGERILTINDKQAVGFNATYGDRIIGTHNLDSMYTFYGVDDTTVHQATTL